MTARERLNSALALLLEADRWPRCCADPDGGWLSDDATERAAAAELCRGCPLTDACAEAGAAERFGVFGGLDRTPKARPAGRTRKAS